MANVMILAKAYQKKHPRTPWQECIKKVSGKKKTPVRKAAVKKTVARKKVVSGISKKKVVKTTIKKERYSIAGFKVHKWTVKTNEGTFPIVATTKVLATKEAKLLIKAENLKRKLIKKKPLLYRSVALA